MQSNEEFYKWAANELETSPRQGLLIKCMAKCEGDEAKGKAMYIETRVKEMEAINPDVINKRRRKKEFIAKLLAPACFHYIWPVSAIYSIVSGLSNERFRILYSTQEIAAAWGLMTGRFFGGLAIGYLVAIFVNLFILGVKKLISNIAKWED